MRFLIGLERALIVILWLAWLAYWIAAARQTAANRRTESLLTGVSYRIPLLIGIILIVFSRASLPAIGFDLWPPNPFILGITVILDVVGLSFAVWARLHLGKYWSGRITLKVDHRVIQTGPYAWVRHPKPSLLWQQGVPKTCSVQHHLASLCAQNGVWNL